MYFLKLNEWVLQDTKLSLSDKVVYSKVLQMNDKPKGCIMTNEQLANSLCLSTRTVVDSLKTLREMEYINSETTRNANASVRKLTPLRSENDYKKELQIKLKSLSNNQ